MKKLLILFSLIVLTNFVKGQTINYETKPTINTKWQKFQNTDSLTNKCKVVDSVNQVFGEFLIQGTPVYIVDSNYFIALTEDAGDTMSLNGTYPTTHITIGGQSSLSDSLYLSYSDSTALNGFVHLGDTVHLSYTGGGGTGGADSTYIWLSGDSIHAFGNSITYGYYASVPDSFWVTRLGVSLNRNIHNLAVSGALVEDVAAYTFPVKINDHSISLVSIGTNDARGSFNDDNGKRIYENTLKETMYWLGIPDSSKVIGRQTSKITYYGTWDVSSAGQVYDIGAFSNTANDSAVYHFNGTGLIFTSLAYASGHSSGTYDLYIDNVKYNSYNTDDGFAWSSLSYDYRPRVIEIDGLTLGDHTLKMVNTSNQYVFLAWLAPMPFSFSNILPSVYVGNIIKQTAASYITHGGSDAIIGEFNNIIKDAIADVARRGINATEVDECSVINTATDLYVDGLHPIDAGHRKIANAFYETMNMVEQPREKTLSTINPNIISNETSITFKTKEGTTGEYAEQANIHNNKMKFTIDTLQIGNSYLVDSLGYLLVYSRGFFERPTLIDTFSIRPDDVTGLLAWFKADSLVTDAGGGVVSDWGDCSGNNNDMTQGTVGARPSIIAAQLNGKPVIRMDGNNDKMDLTTPINVGTYTLFYVAKYTKVNGDANVLFGNAGTAYSCIFYNNAFDIRGTSGDNTITTSTLKNSYDYARINSTSNNITLYTGGISLGSVNPNGNLIIDGIGEFSADTYRWTGDIVEWFIFDSNLNAQTCQQLENYLKNKYY